MKRREFITLVGGAAATWPLVVQAQQPNRLRTIGVLMNLTADDPEGPTRITAFRQKLQDLGWDDGNLRMEVRWPGGDVTRMRSFAEELVRLPPHVILVTSNPAMAVMQQVSRTTPIVFVTVADPVGSGFIESLARPGGNVTGFTNFETSMGGKWLDLLKEIAPNVRRVGVLYHPETASTVSILRNIESAAPSLKIDVVALGVHDAVEVERAVVSLAEGSPASSLIVIPHPVTGANREKIISMAFKYRLPAVYAFRYFVSDGGLMSYGIDQTDAYRQGATYVDRILRGAKPSDLPVQAPTKFQLIVNLKTAKALGLTVPPTLVARADEVIE
jgi:putative tryptophan/tyrosine transport system substrate-binding protein